VLRKHHVISPWHADKQQRATDLQQIVGIVSEASAAVLWKQMENNFVLLVLTVLPVRHQLGKHCTWQNL